MLCLGEAARMSGEAASRAHPGLPGRQREFAEAVLGRARARGTPVIVLLFSGRPLIVPWLVEKAGSVIAAWFPGCEAGNAIADVITGRVSPSGRTPVTWARAAGQIPSVFRPAAGRPPGESQRPFHGQVSRCPERAAVSFRPRPRLRPLHAVESAGVAAPGDGGRHPHGSRRCEQCGRAGRGGNHFSVHPRQTGAGCATGSRAQGLRQDRSATGRPGTVELQLPASELRFLGAGLEPVLEAGEVEILVGPSAQRSVLLVEIIRVFV